MESVLESHGLCVSFLSSRSSSRNTISTALEIECNSKSPLSLGATTDGAPRELSCETLLAAFENEDRTILARAQLHDRGAVEVGAGVRWNVRGVLGIVPEERFVLEDRIGNVALALDADDGELPL